MRKKIKITLLLGIILIACALMFAACDGGTLIDTTDPNVTDDLENNDENGNHEDDLPDNTDPHTHSYSEKWVFDTSSHWHECGDVSCTVITDRAAHDWNSENTCTVCESYKSPLVFTLENGTYTVTDYLPLVSEDEIIIPSKYKGVDVTKIGIEAFNYSSIKSIIFPTTITSIEARAFENCTELTSITIPGSVTYIGYGAFQGCERLKSFVIEDAKVSIADHAFFKCPRLTDISLGNCVTSIGSIGNMSSPFEGSKYYDSLANWENGVLYIGNYLIKAETTISGDYKVKEGTIAIADGAFYNCASLKSVTIPEGVKRIGSYTFSKSGITSINIPNGVTVIEDYAFNGCYYLKSATIPNSVTNIGINAFSKCLRLSDLKLGNGIKEIGTNAFGDVPCGTWDNNVFYIGNYLITATDSIESTYIVKDGTIGIANYAFSNCLRLLGVSLPNSITSIGVSAFEGCSNLASVNIPDSVTTIGDRAFNKCSCLEKITIPASVTSLGLRVFEECTSLTTVTIEANISEIGNATFYGCYSLTSVTLPDTVTSIGSSAFSGCEDLTELKLPKGVKSIGFNAFWGCNKLSSINVPDNVQSVGTGAFSDTAYFKNQSNWENGVFYFGNHLISASTSLSGEYKIKEGTLSIGDGAFDRCSYLTAISIPESVVRIGDQAFANCSKLTSVVVPESVEAIGNSAFGGCSELESITLPFTGKNRTANDIESHLGYIFGYSKSTVKPQFYHYYEGGFYYTFAIPSVLKNVVITDDFDIELSKVRNITSITVPPHARYLYIESSKLTSVNYRGFVDSWKMVLCYDNSTSYILTCIDGK